MREILFRGKTKDGDWRESSAVFIRGELAIMLNERPIKEVIKDKNGESVDVIFSFCAVEKNTVGQFTGLTDKNSKKIFEGDIVKGYWGTFFVVYYDKDYLQYRAKLSNGSNREIDYYGDGTELEVIGNIHDSPELLKELQE